MDMNAQQILSANDIVEVIGSYFPLVAVGSSHLARCPFHDEETPTFTVSRETQLFSCRGCGAAGDVARFVVLYEHLEYSAALQRLAARAGISASSAIEQALDEAAAIRVLKEMIEKHSASWRRIEITGASGDVHVFQRDTGSETGGSQGRL